MATPKNKILDKFHIDYNSVQNSRKWFQSQVDSMNKSKVTPGNILGARGSNLTFKITPGALHFFRYDPKLKDVLPFYDTFPLVIPYKSVPGGFLGLNLHYLDYKERFALFKKLLELNNSTLSDTTKIKYSWATVAGFSTMLGAHNCIKHYLYDHLASPLSKIAPNDWVTAIMLPVERFEGATKQYVWNHKK